MEKNYVKLAIEGDESALNYLINKYKDYAFSIAFNLCREEQFSQDIVQEAFINVFLSIKRFRNESKFSTWLFRIVYREAIKQMKVKVLPRQFDSDTISLMDPNNIEKTIENDQKKGFIKTALNKLNKKDRVVLELFYLNEKKIHEINEITGLTKGNIKVILYRGRNSLKLILENHLGEEILDIL